MERREVMGAKSKSHRLEKRERYAREVLRGWRDGVGKENIYEKIHSSSSTYPSVTQKHNSILWVVKPTGGQVLGLNSFLIATRNRTSSRL